MAESECISRAVWDLFGSVVEARSLVEAFRLAAHGEPPPWVHVFDARVADIERRFQAVEAALTPGEVGL